MLTHQPRAVRELHKLITTEAGAAVGASVPRTDGLAKLTGAERYGADVIPDVWAILESAFETFGVFPVLLERDFNLPPLAELLGEVERIAQLQRRWTERNDARRRPA